MIDKDLDRLCCYMRRQERRTGMACTTLAEMNRVATDGKGDVLRRYAQGGGLIAVASMISCGLEKRAVWRLTEAGRRRADGAAPDAQAWRLAPPRVEAAA